MARRMNDLLREQAQAVKAAPLLQKQEAAEQFVESMLAWITDVENRLEALEKIQ